MFKQRAPQRTLAPTVADLYWAAGFLEGEGCFASRESPHPKWKVPTLGIDVLAVQVQKEPLERLQRWFGGSLRQREQTPSTHGYEQQPIWRWSLTSSRGIGLMMTLYKLMSPIRQEQIRKAIAMWRARPLKRHWAHCVYGHEFDEANTRQKKAHGYTFRKCRRCDFLYQQLYQARKYLLRDFGLKYGPRLNFAWR